MNYSRRNYSPRIICISLYVNHLRPTAKHASCLWARLVTLLVKAGFYATILAHLTSILLGSNGTSLGKVGCFFSNLAHNVTESRRLLCAVAGPRFSAHLRRKTATEDKNRRSSKGKHPPATLYQGTCDGKCRDQRHFAPGPATLQKICYLCKTGTLVRQ